MTGRVVSTKLKNTATVLVERTAMHSLYKKTYLRSKKYLVDDTLNVKDGDIVEIIKCKPVSKNKHWRIVKVIGQNLAEIVEAEQKKAAEKIIAEAVPVGRQVMPEEKEEIKLESENNEKKVIVDNSTKKPISKRKGRTELSKKK